MPEPSIGLSHIIASDIASPLPLIAISERHQSQLNPTGSTISARNSEKVYITGNHNR